MAREIKFRAWIPAIGEVVSVWKIDFNLNKIVWGDDCEQIWENYFDGHKKDCELMQYTGLKDKNGKDIYEGDIVGREEVYHFIEREGRTPAVIGKWKIIGEKSKNFTGKKEEKYIAGYCLEVVGWEDSSCGFEPFADSEENCGHCGGGIRTQDIEVIGNIHEHPELLTQAL